MKKIIVDTNILFSALSYKSGYGIRNILFSDKFLFYSPSFVFVEIFKYKEKISNYSKVDENQLLKLLYRVIKPVHIHSENYIANDNYRKAYAL